MSRFLPISASAHGPAIDQVLALVHWLMLVLFAGWGLYFLWVLYRYRSGKQPRANHAGAGGRVALATEVGVVVAEVVLLVVFALPLWFSRTSARPTDPNPVVARIVAEQFAWNVHYPGADGQFGTTSVSLVNADNPVGLDRKSPNGADDIVTIGQLHLPINRPVLLQLSSKDVIHSFGVMALRIKQDAIPGTPSPIWFTPTATGEFEIACSQLCGLGHYRMRGVVTVESAEAFAAFLASEAPVRR